MTDLVEFLRARLDEDEQTARWAMQYSGLRERNIGETWEVARTGPEKQRLQVQAVYKALTPKPVVGFADPAFYRKVAEHIARHDPARVLREVERDRLIVDLHNQGGERWEGFPRADKLVPYCIHDNLAAPCPTLRLLALLYVDHPNYCEEWKP